MTFKIIQIRLETQFKQETKIPTLDLNNELEALQTCNRLNAGVLTYGFVYIVEED